MDAKDRYVAHLLDRYRKLPGTLGHILRDDRQTARALHDRHIGLEIVEQAFLLAIARRTLGSDQPAPPIRTLRYFLPLVEELLAEPIDPDYLRYLHARLGTAGGHSA